MRIRIRRDPVRGLVVDMLTVGDDNGDQIDLSVKTTMAYVDIDPEVVAEGSVVLTNGGDAEPPDGKRI
jgi:hypothetical protein